MPNHESVWITTSERSDFGALDDLPWPVKAAVRFADQAQFHPRRYCLALARLIDADGSRVFERTRAVDVEDGSPCVIKTDRHDVRAAFVVLAPTGPSSTGRLLCQVPSRAGVRARRGPRGTGAQGVYITGEEPTRSIRQHPFDGGELIILSGDSHKTGQDDKG